MVELDVSLGSIVNVCSLSYSEAGCSGSDTSDAGMRYLYCVPFDRGRPSIVPGLNSALVIVFVVFLHTGVILLKKTSVETDPLNRIDIQVWQRRCRSLRLVSRLGGEKARLSGAKGAADTNLVEWAGEHSL